MELLPVIVVLAVGVAGFCSMAIAFVLVARAGCWQHTMQPTADGRWPLPRRLMILGATLGCLFGLLYFDKGVRNQYLTFRGGRAGGALIPEPAGESLAPSRTRFQTDRRDWHSCVPSH